jgi:hypothetical protein
MDHKSTISMLQPYPDILFPTQLLITKRKGAHSLLYNMVSCHIIYLQKYKCEAVFGWYHFKGAHNMNKS